MSSGTELWYGWEIPDETDVISLIQEKHWTNDEIEKSLFKNIKDMTLNQQKQFTKRNHGLKWPFGIAASGDTGGDKRTYVVLGVMLDYGGDWSSRYLKKLDFKQWNLEDIERLLVKESELVNQICHIQSQEVRPSIFLASTED